MGKPESMKNVLCVVPNLQYGGISNQVFILARSLKDAGYDISIVALYEDGPMAADYKALGMRATTLLSVRVGSVLRNRGGAKKGLFLKAYNKAVSYTKHVIVFFKLWFYILKNKPAIIHTYHFYANTMGRILSVINRIPVCVATETNTTKTNYTKLQSFATGYLARFANAIIAMSCDMKKSLVEHEGIPADKIDVVYTTIDFDKLKPVQAKKRDCRTVGTVGMLEPRKGQIYFLESAAVILKKFPETLFLLAGDGPLRQRLTERAGELGISESCKFLGNFGDIADVMEEVDIFVLASVTDGLPATIIEAMSYGKPVVASKVDGIPEEVEDNVTGYLVSPKDVDALAGAVMRLLSDERLASSMGEAGRKFARQKFGTENVVPKLISIYERELAKASGRRRMRR